MASPSPSPSAMDIDSNTALELVKKGASLLLLDVPQFTLLGIDTQIFSTGPKFKGIKMVPPGCHFLYYSSSNKEGSEFAPITGFFLILGPSQVVVRRWDQKDERLIKLSEDEEFRYAEAVKRLEFDSQLGPYQLDRYSEWNQLSNFLSQDITERLEPIGGEITVMQEAGLIESKGPQTEMEKRLMNQLKGAKCSSIEGSKSEEQKGCYYTSIPHFVRNKQISGDELTALNIDKTNLLETILNRDYGGQEDLLLGEVQFSFIAFMMGQSLEAFYQWKSIISLLLSCTKAPLHTRTHLFSKPWSRGRQPLTLPTLPQYYLGSCSQQLSVKFIPTPILMTTSSLLSSPAHPLISQSNTFPHQFPSFLSGLLALLSDSRSKHWDSIVPLTHPFINHCLSLSFSSRSSSADSTTSQSKC